MNLVQPSAGAPLLGEGVLMRPMPADAPVTKSNTWGRSPFPALAPDGVAAGASSLFGGAPQTAGSTGLFGITGGGAGPQGGGFLGVINGLINQITSILNGYAGETNAEGPASQSVSDGTFASTGDPHLSENATVLNSAGNASSVNHHFDSMSSHDNLLSSQDFDGGYRVSTSVTAPNAKGVTMNASATVHLNSDQDAITMQNDGTFSIASDGNSVALDTPGQSVTLGGGEQVTRNTDGSLTVGATNIYGGSISTTLTAKGGGVDVSANVHNATVGGDIASGSAIPAPAPTIGNADPTLRFLQST